MWGLHLHAMQHFWYLAVFYDFLWFCLCWPGAEVDSVFLYVFNLSAVRWALSTTIDKVFHAKTRLNKLNHTNIFQSWSLAKQLAVKYT